MRERRGPLGRTVGAFAESLASAAKGRQTLCQPRVVVYDDAGHSRLLRADSPEHERLLETAGAFLDVVAEGRPGA